MSKGRNQHVVPNRNGGWNVKGAGNTKATSHHATQKEAIKTAERIAKNQKQTQKFMEEMAK